MKINKEQVQKFVSRFMNVTIVVTTMVAGFGTVNNVIYYFQAMVLK